MKAKPLHYWPRTQVLMPEWASASTLRIAESTTVVVGTSPIAPADLYGTERMKDMERAHILHVLAANKGHRRKTAEALGIGQRTLTFKLKEYGVNKPKAEAK